MSVSRQHYGTHQGAEITALTMTNKNGAVLTVMNFGCRILSLRMPDRDGNIEDVILGFDDLVSYEKDGTSQGAMVGRYGNRIARAQFTMDGVTYHLAANNGRNHLHGGFNRMGSRVWDIDTVGENCVTFHLFSPDGDEHYPGNMNIYITYTLTDDNEMVVNYKADTDKKTIINLTNHSFFNLTSCTQRGTVLDHILQVESDAITEVDQEMIPTGRLLQTAGTAFDFTTPKRIGQDIFSDDPQLKLARGYDHNFVLRGTGMRRVATLYSPQSGRRMEVITDQLGAQIFTANGLNHAELPMRHGRPQEPYAAVCLETQHFPDSPNHPEFPSTVLEAGKNYDTTTIFRFSVQ